MEKNKGLRAALTGPVIDKEPVMLKDLPMDNVVGAMTALASEVYILRERLAVMEAELTRHGVVAQLEELYTGYEPQEQDWEAVGEEIEVLRTKIQRLGNVNLDALTELEELTPRFEELAAQREDVLQSIEQLQKLIEELDEESTRRFYTARP